MSPEDMKELYQLLNALREDVITDEQFDRLDQMISGDHQACQIYVDYVRLWADLVGVQAAAKPGLDQTLALSGPMDVDDLSNSKLWQALAEDEKNATAVIVEKPREDKIICKQDWQVVRHERQISKFAIYTLAFSVAAALLLVAMVMFTTPPPVVAWLTDSINDEWVTENGVPVIGDGLRQGPMTLVDGLAEITFGDGAVVTVEAPAKIELTSGKSMFLKSGKVSAQISEYSIGFEVNTPSASIVDLGTEFGVSVVGDGSCSLDMFKGKANLVAGIGGQKRSSQIITVSQARSVDHATGKVRVKKFQKNNFIRQIDSESGFIWRGRDIDLADIVGGGNGFGSGLHGSSCINPGTGELYVHVKSDEQYSDNKYHPCDELPIVDGVFVPDGGSGPVQVTSAGHVWKDCPDTTGIFYEGIYTGFKTRSPIRNHGFVLKGQHYGTFELQAMVTHSNAGVTFDVAALRSQLFCLKIVRFEALCGVSQEAGNKYPGNVSDFYVLVDGEKRFEAKGVGVYSEPVKVSVKLSEGDRFLTLVSTDGDLEPHHDWSFYAEPKLVLE
ncbi:MAG: NPCBM/NEW2 domain-containing protein [Anaerohalosphaera sp.]|nr:NPCBM/NEW2 domain-containing protein [Anaerohalosphaera sp.]